MYRYTGKNTRSFSAVCGNRFGRMVITTGQDRITRENIILELGKALAIHQQNAIEIDYLDKYYRGDQPILYRKKQVRPDINNRVVQNLAMFVVETKTSEMVGEPIQYVLHGTDEAKSEQVTMLNTIMEGEDKSYFDIELCRWRSICGTAYRFIGNDEDRAHRMLLDEADFYLSTEDPRYTFVAYYTNGAPAFSCQIRHDVENRTYYNIFTDSEWFRVAENQIIASGINGNGAIPVIEYPNNARRLSDIEITISLTDEMNVMASDRANGIEGFVSAWIKFVNCEVDKEQFEKMRLEGALVVKSNNRTENAKADVDILSSELNQSESQVAVNDQFEKLLIIQGIADRQSNTGGDTAGAVQLRNGHSAMEKRSEISEPVFKRSERMALRIILNRLRINHGMTLLPSDVEIKISRTKSDNMLTKAEALQMLLTSGINPERAIKTVGLFSDPEQVAVESKERLDILYPTTLAAVEAVQSSEEVIEVDNGAVGS